MKFTPLMALLLEASDHQPLRRIARETGFDHTRLRRMAVGETPWNPLVVVALARRYRVPLGAAFAAAGWITAAEARALEPSLSIRSIPHTEVLAEIVRRIDAGELLREGPVSVGLNATRPEPEEWLDQSGSQAFDHSHRAPLDVQPSGLRCDPSKDADLMESIAASVQRLEEAERRVAALRAGRNRQIRQARNEGVASKEIGALLGVSQQRVANIVAEST